MTPTIVITGEVCKARDAAGEVHDRKWAFLDDGLISEWLAPRKLEEDEREHLHGLLGEASEKIAASLVTHPVNRAVNNVRDQRRARPAHCGAKGLPARSHRQAPAGCRLVSGLRAFAPTRLSSGRGDPPESVFVEGDGGEGDEAWRLAREGKPLYEADIRRSHLRFMDTSQPRKYRSFITMPVLVGDEPVGLLTISSPREKGLPEDDVVPVAGSRRALRHGRGGEQQRVSVPWRIVETGAGGTHGAHQEAHVDDDRTRSPDGSEARAHH